MLKHIVGVLIVIQSLLLLHMLLLYNEGLAGLPVAAVPGTVTEVTITPNETAWGGTYGELTPTGATTISSVGGTITQQDVYYEDSDNNCSRTELFASVVQVDINDITPVDPIQADIILGLNPAQRISVAFMFLEQEPFDIGSQTYNLYVTRTRGKLGEFVQGVAQANGNVVFITKTKRNAQAYNGDPAGYQFLLPAGPWIISFDYTDACSLLDEYMLNGTLISERENKRLDIALPTRVCVGRDNIMQAVEVLSRLYCTMNEVGQWYCNPIDATSTIYHRGEEIKHNNQEGRIVFNPPEVGEYLIDLRTTNLTTRRLFHADNCIDPSLMLGEERYVEYPTPDVSAQEREAQKQTPQEIIEQAMKEYVLLSLLTIMIIVLAMIAYYEKNKDTTKWILKARIKVLERLSR